MALDATLLAPVPSYAADATPGWNLAVVGAPQLWSLGLDGRGVVVATLDTGVDVLHPDLGPRWRGGHGGWLDPFRGTASPYDAIGHGTQTTAIAVGGEAGVAPGASWIAAKIYDDAGRTTVSVVHEAFQWLLDPDGDPSTADAPDVVNASWGIGATNGCESTFQPDLDALRAAGIFVVFAAGNGGPAAATSTSPANGPGVLSAGAVDASRAVASFSGRGPSACTGAIYPDLVAPGVSVRTADLSFAGTAQYVTVSGTSYAAPHVAGVAALLLEAFPGLEPDALESALRSTAADLAAPGPDDDSGRGLVDAAAAHAALSDPGREELPPLRVTATAAPAPASGGCASAGAGAPIALLGLLAAARGRTGGHRRPGRQPAAAAAAAIAVRIGVPSRTIRVTGVFSAISASFARRASSSGAPKRSCRSNPTGGAVLVQPAVHLDLPEVPPLALRVHPQRDRGAARESAEEELHRRRAGVGPAAVGRLVRRDVVAARTEPHRVARRGAGVRRRDEAALRYVVAHCSTLRRRAAPVSRLV